MKKIILSFEVLAAIIAVTILQACAATTTTTQCAKPTLTPPGYSGTARNVTVTIKTATAGAYLRYTLDGSTPTGGSSGHGTRIAAASGKVSFGFDARGRTLKAISYKAGWADSLIAVGNYVYESPRWLPQEPFTSPRRAALSLSSGEGDYGSAIERVARQVFEAGSASEIKSTPWWSFARSDFVPNRKGGATKASANAITLQSKPGDVLLATHKELEARTKSGLARATARAAEAAADAAEPLPVSSTAQLRDLAASAARVFGWDSDRPGVQLNQQFVITQEQLAQMRALCDADEAEREENNEHCRPEEQRGWSCQEPVRLPLAHGTGLGSST